MTANLIGQWRLADYYVCHEDGREIPWQGQKEGYLIYTGQGHVSARITRIAQGDDIVHPDKPSEMWYEGTYHFGDDHTLVHTIEKAWDQTRVGKDMVRNFEFEDQDTLVLTGENQYNTFRIIWKREI